MKSPEVRLTHGGTAEKHGFFSQGDFRTKIAILPYIWDTNLVDKVRTGRVPGCLRSIERNDQNGSLLLGCLLLGNS